MLWLHVAKVTYVMVAMATAYLPPLGIIAGEWLHLLNSYVWGCLMILIRTCVKF